MIIRDAEEKDIDQIYQIGKSVKEFGDSKDVTTFWPKHVLRSCIKSKTDWLIIAEENDKIFGFVVVNYSPVFKKAVVENVFVSPQHRGRDIGKKLLAEAIKKIQKTGCEYTCVIVQRDNQSAINFYLKNDFKYGFEKNKSFVWLERVLSKKFA